MIDTQYDHSVSDCNIRFVAYRAEAVMADTDHLTPAQEGIYHRIYKLSIYHKGPIRLELLLGRGTHARTIRCLLRELEDAGKIAVDGDEIRHRLALNDLENSARRVRKNSENGAERWKNNGLEKKWHTNLNLRHKNPSLRGRSLSPRPVDKSAVVPAAGGYARQRAGGALASPPAGGVREHSEQTPVPEAPASKPECSLPTVGEALPPELRVAEPETPEENPSAAICPAELELNAKAQRWQEALDHAHRTLEGARLKSAVRGLMGLDPEADDEQWIGLLRRDQAFRDYAEAAE